MKSKSALLYAVFILGGLGLGMLSARMPGWLNPPYVEGNYSAYYPDAQTQVVLYGTSWCGYCARTRAYFAEQKIPYRDLDIEKDPVAAAQFAQLGGGGVPKVLIGDRRIDGYVPRAFAAALEKIKAPKS